MMDLIDRQAAIKALEETKQPDPFNRYEYQNIGIDWSIDAITALPSAQPGEDIRAMCGECDAWNQYKNYPQPEWVPWDSGKFPKESGTYTVTAYDGATKRVTYAKYQKRLKRWELTGARAYWKVLAWQPMPKPWEGEPNE